MTDSAGIETSIKNIELSDGRKAVIKSKWNSSDDRVEVEIFIRETFSVYAGSCWQKKLRTNKINVDYQTIKDTLTSPESLEFISYELDEAKFSVVAQDVSSSDTSIGDIIYLKVDVTKLEPDEVIFVMQQMLDDMSELLKLKSTLNKCKSDLKKEMQKYESLKASKKEFDDNSYQTFLCLLNAKKEQIAKLEKQLQRSKNSGNKFANLSSDFDQSDVSLRGAGSTAVQTPLQSSEEFSKEPQPSTSKASLYKSPARKKLETKVKSPAMRSTQRRTPKKTPTKPLFNFKDDTDDSLDELHNLKSKLKSPKSKKQLTSNLPIKDDMFANVSVKIIQKQTEDNPSSAELYTPKKGARKRLHSSSSDASRKSRGKSITPDFLEPAQKFAFEDDREPKTKPTAKRSLTSKSVADSSSEEPKKIEDLYKVRVKSQDSNKSDDDIFTQKLIIDDIDDVVQSSQPADSPSIFEPYSIRRMQQSPRSTKRKSQQSPRSAKKETKKSKFSIDTMDILAEISP